MWGWAKVDPDPSGAAAPCQRSLHVAAVHDNSIYVFGGYDGSNRVNDFHAYSVANKTWALVPAAGIPPSPRDRHTGVVHKNSFYVFGGFDGTARVNDFFRFSFDTRTWSKVTPSQGSPPTPRHSHAALVFGDSMFVFGGYDGSYRNDFHEFNFATNEWSLVNAAGRVPRARYRATCNVYKESAFLFGGHDGTRHLNDVHVFSFDTRVWVPLETQGHPPIPRDSHVSVTHGKSLYVFGGSTGSAMNDFHELALDTCKWATVPPNQNHNSPVPNHRFCHVACVVRNSLFVMGGYDGTNRLNDLLEFRFSVDITACDIPKSTLVEDLGHFVNSDVLSDITFIVEGQPVYAHKVLCMRCTYFRAMLTGEMMESRAKEITLPDVRRPIFLALLEYLYTDHVEIPLDIAMELFQAADQFGVDRLKRMCEGKMLSSINVENAATIFHAADLHDAKSLREKTLSYVLQNFDSVSKTPAFQDMGAAPGGMQLIFEVLKNR